MKPQRLVVGGDVADALGDVEDDAGEAGGVEIDFLVVGDLADGAGEGVRVREIDEWSRGANGVLGCWVVRWMCDESEIMRVLGTLGVQTGNAGA